MSNLIACALWIAVLPLGWWGQRKAKRELPWLLAIVAVWFTGLGFFLAWLIS